MASCPPSSSSWRVAITNLHSPCSLHGGPAPGQPAAPAGASEKPRRPQPAPGLWPCCPTKGGAAGSSGSAGRAPRPRDIVAALRATTPPAMGVVTRLTSAPGHSTCCRRQLQILPWSWERSRPTALTVGRISRAACATNISPTSCAGTWRDWSAWLERALRRVPTMAELEERVLTVRGMAASSTHPARAT